MRLTCDKAALFVLLLVQLAVALAGSTTPRTIVLGHTPACDTHAHAHHDVSPTQIRHVHAPQGCDNAHALDTPLAPMMACCPCPHIHLRLLDGPLARAQSHNLKDSLPRAGAIIPLIAADIAATRNRPPSQAPWAYGLVPSHPPPAGLATTILVI